MTDCTAELSKKNKMKTKLSRVLNFIVCAEIKKKTTTTTIQNFNSAAQKKGKLWKVNLNFL